MKDNFFHNKTCPIKIKTKKTSVQCSNLMLKIDGQMIIIY